MNIAPFFRFCFFFALSCGPLACLLAQADEGKEFFLDPIEEVEMALAAGPEHILAQAAVYTYGKDGYQQIRRGSNGFTCLVNRDGNQYGGNALRPTCWDAEGSATIVPVMMRVGKMMAEGKSATAIKNDIDEGFQSGRYKSPRKNGIAYMLRGDIVYDRGTGKVTDTVFPPHYMLYAPGMTNADIGMTEAAFAKNPSLPMVYDGYSGGANTAYIIIVAAEAGATHLNH